jgi:hypothetical protein
MRIASATVSDQKESKFDDGIMSSLLPHIRCVGELQSMDSDFSSSGLCHVFMVYFADDVSVEFGFDTREKAASTRRDLIVSMAGHWGPDQLVYTKYDVTVVPAIVDVNGIYTKDDRAGFAITVDGVAFPLHLIFSEVDAAIVAYQELCTKVEMQRCRQAMHKIVVNA